MPEIFFVQFLELHMHACGDEVIFFIPDSARWCNYNSAKEIMNNLFLSLDYEGLDAVILSGLFLKNHVEFIPSSLLFNTNFTAIVLHQHIVVFSEQDLLLYAIAVVSHLQSWLELLFFASPEQKCLWYYEFIFSLWCDFCIVYICYT